MTAGQRAYWLDGQTHGRAAAHRQRGLTPSVGERLYKKSAEDIANSLYWAWSSPESFYFRERFTSERVLHPTTLHDDLAAVRSNC